MKSTSEATHIGTIGVRLHAKYAEDDGRGYSEKTHACFPTLCRAAMAVMGAGSVSSYVMQHAPLPVALVRQDVQLQAVPQAAVRQGPCLGPDPCPSKLILYTLYHISYTW